jgi:hypothetical protein
VVSIVARDRTAALMQRAKTWLTLHERPILICLFAVIGTLYTVKGLLALL